MVTTPTAIRSRAAASAPATAPRATRDDGRPSTSTTSSGSAAPASTRRPSTPRRTCRPPGRPRGDRRDQRRPPPAGAQPAVDRHERWAQRALVLVLNALANQGAGNTLTALEHMRRAVKLDRTIPRLSACACSVPAGGPGLSAGRPGAGLSHQQMDPPDLLRPVPGTAPPAACWTRILLTARRR